MKTTKTYGLIIDDNIKFEELKYITTKVMIDLNKIKEDIRQFAYDELNMSDEYPNLSMCEDDEIIAEAKKRNLLIIDENININNYENLKIIIRNINNLNHHDLENFVKNNM